MKTVDVMTILVRKVYIAIKTLVSGYSWILFDLRRKYNENMYGLVTKEFVGTLWMINNSIAMKLFQIDRFQWIWILFIILLQPSKTICTDFVHIIVFDLSRLFTKILSYRSLARRTTLKSLAEKITFKGLFLKIVADLQLLCAEIL